MNVGLRRASQCTRLWVSLSICLSSMAVRARHHLLNKQTKKKKLLKKFKQTTRATGWWNTNSHHTDGSWIYLVEENEINTSDCTDVSLKVIMGVHLPLLLLQYRVAGEPGGNKAVGILKPSLQGSSTPSRVFPVSSWDHLHTHRALERN